MLLSTLYQIEGPYYHDVLALLYYKYLGKCQYFKLLVLFLNITSA